MNYTQILWFLICFSVTAQGMMIQNIQDLEKSFKDLEVSKFNAPNCAKIAMACWSIGDDLLNNVFDNEHAIKCFHYFIEIYELLEAINQCTPALNRHLIPAHTSIAMAFHNIGQQKSRDFYMAKAQRLLGIDRIENYDPKNFNPAACEYFVTDGYRHYIKFEESEKSEASVDEQEKHLHDAMTCFKKAIAISDKFKLEGFAKSNAIHGEGTMLEFLGKCQLRRDNKIKAIENFQKAICCFEEAIGIRRRMLSQYHPLVARSFHKLARNYVLLAQALDQADFMQKAFQYYQEALTIFSQSQVPQIQAKRVELFTEYEKFREKYAR